MKTVQQDDKQTSHLLKHFGSQPNSRAYPAHDALDLENAQHCLMGQLMLILLKYENVTI
jgi:hypothetical protein